MSVQPVTRYIAVCDGCAAAFSHVADSGSDALSTACNSTWSNTSFGLLCPDCQPCTECSHNSGPVSDGRLCDTCRAAACARCGHQRREHLQFRSAPVSGLPRHICHLLDGSYVRCECPFEAGTPAEVRAHG